jgi:cation transport ATPase
MMGDRVNSVPALKAADTAFAMSSGMKVAENAGKLREECPDQTL